MKKILPLRRPLTQRDAHVLIETRKFMSLEGETPDSLFELATSMDEEAHTADVVRHVELLDRAQLVREAAYIVRDIQNLRLSDAQLARQRSDRARRRAVKAKPMRSTGLKEAGKGETPASVSLEHLNLTPVEYLKHRLRSM